jgi:SAM-dependent methyltransferase
VSFYDTEEGVAEYVEMAFGHDGRELIAVLEEHLPAGARVLELGMGPGKDLDLLARRYAATGSDRSTLFLERYRAAHPDADLLRLDAVTLETERRFDAIFSNKVLHHLDEDELACSIARQASILRPAGLVMHSFWYGDRDEELAGMPFHYRDEACLSKAFEPTFELARLKRYPELDDGDSVYVLAKLRTTRHLKSRRPGTRRKDSG